MSVSGPRISVVVATYGRPELLATAVKSILASEHDSFELIVADQNEEAPPLGDFITDTRLRILRIPPENLSVARNRGTKAARGELIAYTDDDCEVTPHWLRAIEDAFGRPDAGLVLGSVAAGEHDRSQGFIPACMRSANRMHRRFVDCPELEVMGASMAVRKDVWESVRGFSEEIGPGTPIPAGEDYDFVLRVLQAGIGVLECPDAVVAHHGFRTWKQGRELLEGYAFGTAYVLGYRLGGRPVDTVRCLTRFWRSYRNRKSRIVKSARRLQGNRLLQFGRGWVAGVRARWLPTSETEP